ncbi:MAG: D-alanyl-D-alanine carboxypeptidase [Kiritimatiellae bacterium]|nr:D-alanyl-D-alanine carboxypeptidase [Kiritimatiellia bacterium]MDD4736720.1 D-alanyl-D-alanine carboxypeptidase [Kiritimatiellia bacterium]
MNGVRWCASIFLLVWMAGAVQGARNPIAQVSAEPCLGAIAVDAASGEVLEEFNADAAGYPASMVKMMDALILLERVRDGKLRLDERVPVTAEASRMGGSQVYLKEGESFTVDELLYALMIQSANDAAVALALYVAGTKEAFVDLMRQRAAELGMTHTRFESVHGLPPSTGQQPDVSTAGDMALLGRALTQIPDIFRYTSTRERGFRDGSFIMRTHNNLLGDCEGCDGFKTGYFKAGGYSITATAERNGRRVIAVVMGSKQKNVRDRKARELLSAGFMKLPAVQPTPALQVAPTPNPSLEQTPSAAFEEESDAASGGGAEKSSGWWWKTILVLVVLTACIRVLLPMIGKTR